MSNPLWEEYILWKNTPKNERGRIATEEDWARFKGYKDPKTMRVWRSKPEFKALEEKVLARLAKRAAAAEEAESLEIDGDVDYADERDYLVVKGQLLNSAKSGNLKATELFMKLYGKTWIEEEQSSRTSDYSTMDLDKLVAIAAASLAPGVLAKALVDAGWTVTEPS